MRRGRRRTDVIRVELIDTNEHTDGRRTQCPREEGTKEGELAGVQVIDEKGVELLKPVSLLGA